ncbi:MAG TPA: glycosyltransferase family 9 protein [Niastella sp.]
MSKELIIVSAGGIGDAIVATPTYKALRQTYPHHRIIVYCVNEKHYNVFLNNPHIDSLRMLKVKHMWKYPRHLYAYLFNRKSIQYRLMAFQHIPLTFIYDKNVKEIIPEIFDLPVKDPKAELYFTHKEEETAKKLLEPFPCPILMHIHSRASQNHHWELERWETLVKELPECTFIQIGHVDEPYVKGAVDFRGKTGLREALCMLKFACSFVGVDSNFSHVTNAFDVPGVVLFGDSSPVFWGHSNNINIYKALPCSPCYYDLWSDPCPYGHECMDAIAVEDVKQALYTQIGKSYKNKNNIQYFKHENV